MMLRSLLQPILRSPLGSPLNRIVSGFFPSRLFASGEQGAWYDPSDRATLFQDSAGTTPVTAVEQPVGLILDKSKGLVLGPELVTNGDFSDGTTGWTATNSPTFTVSSGVATVQNSIGSESSISQVILTAGKWYEVFITRTAAVIGVGRVSIGGNSFALSAGVNRFVVLSSTATFLVTPNSATVGASVSVDNISVRELPGNHAFQATTTSRPVLSARKNLLVGTAVLSTQNVSVRAVGHILSFWGTGTVTLSGASTAGPLVGTGVDNRVYIEFTPTAGTLTLTVSGSVLKAQLEEVNETV